MEPKPMRPGSRQRSSSASSRVKPGDNIDTEGTADLQMRKEFRRRRMESSERLSPMISTPRTPEVAEGPIPRLSVPMQRTLQQVSEEPVGLAVPMLRTAQVIQKNKPESPWPADAADAEGERPKTRRGDSPLTRSVLVSLAVEGVPCPITAPDALAEGAGSSGKSSLGATGDVMMATGMATMGSQAGLMGTARGTLGGMALGGTNGMVGQMFKAALGGAMFDVVGVENVIEDEALLAETSMDAARRPPSPSLMSICYHPDSPMARRALGSPRGGDSPSILVLEDHDEDAPLWTSHKALPSRPRTPPRTPPRSARREKKPVLLGVPEPLSARARCVPGEAPLSARAKRGHSRPAGCAVRRLGGA